MWPTAEVIKAVGGTAYRVERESFASISTDTRTIGRGDLYIPLTGANFDGHFFVEQAYEASLGGALCEKGREEIYKKVKGTVILVENTVQALLDLARWKRQSLTGTCIAITGSNGKTTTKEILVDMMKRSFSVAYNEKNFNNLIGVSKSILSIEGQPQVLVFELGTNSPGEIKALARTTLPDCSLITNINPSHLEGLFDLEGVLAEKLDLFYSTREGGKVFINADDPFLTAAYHDTGRDACVYGIAREAPFHLRVERDLGWDGSEIVLTFPGDEIRAVTRLLGTHNLYNILAASAIAYSAGLGADEIRETIETFRPFSMRFFVKKSPRGFTVVDDTYNANPASMEWAVRTLVNLPCQGKKIAVLGDMRELGEKTAFYHRELGRFLKGTSLPVIALVGEQMKEAFEELGNGRARLFSDKAALIAYVSGILEEGDVILVKGSRAAKMEEIVEALI